MLVAAERVVSAIGLLAKAPTSCMELVLVRRTRDNPGSKLRRATRRPRRRPPISLDFLQGSLLLGFCRHRNQRPENRRMVGGISNNGANGALEFAGCRQTATHCFCFRRDTAR